MTISELRLALDLSFDSKVEILKQHAKQILDGNYLFVDSSNGEFYLFDRNGNEDDIAKLDCIETDQFYNDESLKLVRIPDSVTTIKSYAFSHCSNLTSITIPNSVTYIGNWAFCDCTKLTCVTIPDSVTSIEPSAFEFCSGLINVTIGNHVTNIGTWAFCDCTKLTSMTIGKGVTNIGYIAFSGCTSLKELIFKGKSIDEVKAMEYYPWGVKNKSVIRCEN